MKFDILIIGSGPGGYGPRYGLLSSGSRLPS